MNSQSIEKDENRSIRSRQEYIKLARESCLKNYYGDKIQPRSQILQEINEKRQQEKERESNRGVESNGSTVIPFPKKSREQTIIENRIDAEEINRRLAKNHAHSHTIKEEDTNSLAQETSMYVSELEDMKVSEPPKENIPSSLDILRMSGIEESTENRIETEYVGDYKDRYHKIEEGNFLTSIQNAEPEEEKQDKKGQDSNGVRSYRFFAVRCVLAFLILTAMILCDSFDLSYKGISSQMIYEKVANSEIFQQIEAIVTSMLGS